MSRTRDHVDDQTADDRARTEREQRTGRRGLDLRTRAAGGRTKRDACCRGVDDSFVGSVGVAGLSRRKRRGYVVHDLSPGSCSVLVPRLQGIGSPSGLARATGRLDRPIQSYHQDGPRQVLAELRHRFGDSPAPTLRKVPVYSVPLRCRGFSASAALRFIVASVEPSRSLYPNLRATCSVASWQSATGLRLLHGLGSLLQPSSGSSQLRQPSHQIKCVMLQRLQASRWGGS